MEELNNSVAVQETNAVSNVDNTTDNVSPPSSVSSDQGVEQVSHADNVSSKTFSQDEVNRLIGAAKLKEREKASNASRNTQDHNQSNESHQANHAHHSNAQGNFDISEEVNKVLLQRQQQDLESRALEEAQGIINNFSQKVIDGKDKYDDFDSKLTHVNLENPALVMSLKDLDNPADVLYALGEDPSTYLEIVNGLSSNYTAAAAQAKLQKIATKVKNDEEAHKLHNRGNVPSKIKSSPVNTGNARTSHSEMRKNPKYMW